MRLLSWNCRGLGDPQTVRELSLLLKERDPSILFLSETRLDSVGVELLRVSTKFNYAFCVPRLRTGGGLAMLWSDKVDLRLNSFSKNHIDASVVIKDSGKEFRVTGFYGNPETHKRKETWALLKFLSHHGSLPWVCMGDFNELLDHSECTGTARRPDWQIRDFREALAFAQLFDLGFEGSPFTWIKGRKGPTFKAERLDRIVASMAWINMFEGAKVIHLAKLSSDHCPLMLEFLQVLERVQRHRVFRFEAMWVKDEQSKDVVQQAWSLDTAEGSPMFQVFEKLKHCRVSLIAWSKERFGKLASRIKEKRKRLQELSNVNPIDLSAEILALQDEINDLLEKEEIFWRQRSRVAWMQDGDQNTRFFHAQCNQRRKTNFISGLLDSDGCWQTDQMKVADLAVEYFRNIFTSSQPQSAVIDSCLWGVERVVTQDMNDALLQEFSEEEVRQALWQMYPTKAPGPDGMSAIFYQTYWEIVGPEVTQAILSILHSGYMLRKINYTHIALIPKIKEPKRITDFRPISLCNVIYKIVSKVLANRLKGVLPVVISDSQSAFVPGRLITDNVLVAFETLHSMSLKKKGKKGQMALKLDMSKAYDRVEWRFVEMVMRRLGFSIEWIRLIMMCISSVSYSVLINGKQYGHFGATRGIRQGDSLSPYLFLLCAEGLSSLLRIAHVERNIKGVQASRGGPVLTHLFFADDSLLFCQASLANGEALINILQLYEEASGQQLNRAKTSLFFTKNTPSAMRELIKDLFQVPEIKCHDKYLRLPSFVGRSKKEAFGGLKDRVWRRIFG
jgi:exonuclease III